MPFNGSGTFSRIYSWVVDAANSVNISSTRTDAEMNGFAAGLTNCVTRDGQSPPSADLPMGGKKLVNLGAATVGSDALNRDTADARYVLSSGAVNITITGTFGGAALSLSGNATVGGTVAVTGLLTASGNVRINGTGGISALVIDDHTSASGANIQLIGNGGTTPSKSVRVVGGVYQVVNSAYSTVIWSLDDSGNATFVGTATGLTASPGDNTTKFATTAYVVTALGALTYAPLNSPALTGTPTAPTAAAGTNTTQLATTAFVQAARPPIGQTIASAATVTPTFNDDFVEITAQAAGLTFANPTGSAVNMWGIVARIKDNATPQTIAFGTQYRGVGVTLPTTTVAGKTTVLGMIFNNALTKWDVVSVAQE